MPVSSAAAMGASALNRSSKSERARCERRATGSKRWHSMCIGVPAEATMPYEGWRPHGRGAEVDRAHVIQDLATRYGRALAEALEAPGEAALASAKLVGRDAFGNGLGIRDILAIHHEALVRLHVREGAPMVTAASILNECLAPFDRALHSLREGVA
jgi:hypothetical protein